MPLSPLHLPSIVGRDRELGILYDCLDAAVSGHGGIVLIGGEAGIGKTALAEAVTQEALKQGALVLVGRCYDLTETPPYGPWVELFGRYRQIEGMPPLPPAFAARSTVGDVASEAALFHQVRVFFDELAERRPAVLLLDDLHWADPVSLDLLRFVARDLPGVALLILATYRSDELTAEHPLAQRMPALAREGRATRVGLRRLEEVDIQALVAGRYHLVEGDRQRLVAHLYGRAEGNPFFTEEILRTLEEGRMLNPSIAGWQVGDLTRAHVPPLVRQVIDGRLARLDGERRRLLAVAAVIGQEVPLTLWAAVAGTTEDALLPTIERATEAHLMAGATDGSGMRFVHALIRETLYDAAPLPVRKGWHRRAAEALAGQVDADPDSVADHFRRAGDERAIAWLMRAAERAQAARAVLTAADRFETVLRLVEPRGTTWARERGWLRYFIGAMRRHADPHQGIAHLSEAIRLAAHCEDHDLTAYALSVRGMLHAFGGDCRQALIDKRAERAAPDYRIPPATGVLTRLHMEQSPQPLTGSVEIPLMFAGRYRESLAVAKHRFALGDLDALHMIGTVSAIIGRPEDARDAYSRLYPHLRDASYVDSLAFTLAEELHLVQLPYAADRVGARRELAATVDAAWAIIGDLYGLDPRFIALPHLLLEGAWDVAFPLVQEFAAAPARVNYFNVEGPAGALAYARGEVEIARRLIRRRLPHGPDTPPGATWFAAATAMQRLAAMIAIDGADLPTARGWLDAHDRWLEWSGSVLGRSEGQYCRALYHRAAGDAERAAVCAARARSDASEPRQPLAGRRASTPR